MTEEQDYALYIELDGKKLIGMFTESTLKQAEMLAGVLKREYTIDPVSREEADRLRESILAQNERFDKELGKMRDN